MKALEDRLCGWIGPSSATEQEKQNRAERMIKEAVRDHPAFSGCSLQVYAKGSYANNTNVRSDSDVDVAVQCTDVQYWAEEIPGARPSSISAYTGIWTPNRLRTELLRALEAKFPGQVDASGATAFRVGSNTARVEADVVPCFNYRYYFASGGHRDGARVFKKDGSHMENFPHQQLVNGNAKNSGTGTRYKKAVRILKRTENAMLLSGRHREVPSFFMECLVYNVPNSILMRSTWTDTIRGCLVHIYNELQGEEPSNSHSRWLEVSECKYLFHSTQKWDRSDGRDFALAAWNYLGFAS